MVISYPMSTSPPSNVTNLNQFRKKKARAAKRAAADENATKFGLSKGQKHVTAFDAAKAKSALDGIKTEAKPEPERDGPSPDEADDDHDRPPR